MPKALFPDIVPLADLTPGQEADFFAAICQGGAHDSRRQAVLSRRISQTPKARAAFRSGATHASRPFAATSGRWGTSTTAPPTKRRTSARRLDIRKIRQVIEGDSDHGFDPAMCLPQSRHDPTEMFDELHGIAVNSIGDKDLSTLVASLLDDNRDLLLKLPAAAHNHHAYAGGFLEHVLSVAKTCVYFAEKYVGAFP